MFRRALATALLLLPCAAAAIPGAVGRAAAEAPCLAAGADETLRGTLTQRDYPAPDGAKRPQRVLLLVLAEPRCIEGAGAPEDAVQLTFDWASAEGSALYLEVATAVTTERTLSGQLLPATQPEHRTAILFLVDEMAPETAW